MPTAIAVGPRQASADDNFIECVRTGSGTLAVRGTMVPHAVFAPGARGGLKLDPEGFLDTGCPCRLDQHNALVVTGPPVGLVSVGGYRFAWRELQDLVGGAGEEALIAALPDRLAGHRLAGVASHGEVIRSALIAAGANPLIIHAFRDRPLPGEPT